jgi:hypothetical protein
MGMSPRLTLLCGLFTLLLPAMASTETLLHRADFSAQGLQGWVVEQQPGGTVTVEDGTLVIRDQAGCTVWWHEPLEGPIIIRYEVTMSSAARVSDLNCFWMASDPRQPDDLFAAGHGRDGRFATYDTLQTYYVGYGGNHNSTTRFRRYEGTGAKPLLPEHDLGAAEFMLQPDHRYTIELRAEGGRVRYLRDGEVIFDYLDPTPLTRGWFGFRTVWSEMHIHRFEVLRPAPSGMSDGR